jgi:hypothetical protein
MPFNIKLNKNETILFIIFALIISTNMLMHDMWRDELQAWMLARYSNNLFELFNNIRYESHPSAWHLWLFIISRFTANPIIMQFFQWVSSLICGFLFIKYSPLSILHKSLILFGYFFIFEYNIIARSYSMTLLWLIILCSIWGQRKSPVISGIILLIIANTSIHGAIIAGSLMLYFSFSPKENHWNKKELLIFTAITLLGIILCFIQLIPPVDRFVPADTFHPSVKSVVTSFSTIWSAISPIPVMDGTKFIWFQSFAGSKIFQFLLALISFRIVYLILKRQKVALTSWLIGTGILVIFFALIYMGSIRHYGHIYLLLFALIWLIYQKLNQKELKLLTIIFTMQVIGGIIASTSSWIHPFSMGKTVANYINSSSYSGLNVICAQDFTSSTIVGYLKHPCYYLQREEWGSYIIWDKKRPEITPRDTIERANKFVDKNGSSLMITIQPLSNISNIELINSFSGAIVPDENYYLYLVEKK